MLTVRTASIAPGGDEGESIEEGNGPRRRGGWNPSVDARIEELEPRIVDLLDGRRRDDGGARSDDRRWIDSLRDAERIAIVPDAHYPFHPSSGVVTDPAVVGALARVLERETRADLAVAGGGDEHTSFGQTVAYLGYPDALEGTDADLVDLADEPRENILVDLEAEGLLLGDDADSDGGDPNPLVPLSVPERLLADEVIVVPTLRPTEAGPVAGAMRTLARHVEGPPEPSTVAVAATSAIDPTCALLDATVAYGGDPHATGRLFCGRPSAADAVGATLLDRPLEDDEALRRALRSDGTSVLVEGCDVDALADRIPDGDLPPRTGTHPAVSLAYRTYAAVAGDAVPPQMRGDR
ncbi:hypothetical protein ACFQGT_11575 [Natrialbaceae archaeon GCM10025810]|uniref:hypothetical protein n=1 Tax=Halovalidus salilacus TaxID=3075124 RepID=UPI00361A9951